MAKNKYKNKQQETIKSPATKIELVPTLQAPQREGFDISKWRSAIKQAEDPEYPDMTLLYDIYNDIMLDLHLTAITDKRIEYIKGTQLVFSENGKENEEITTLMDSPWFQDMIGDLLEARFWGYTTAWLDLSGGIFHKYKKYDRRHIVPAKGIFKQKQDDRDGISITEPPYANYIITAGTTGYFGLLIKAAAWVLLKRGDISDWATFNEILAAPIRIGYYPDVNPDVKKEMAKAIGQQGAMPWYLIPEGGKLELKENNSTGSTDAYERFAEFCDKQLSKGFLHATMTLDAEGGEYKGDVHADSEAVIHRSDMRFVLNVLNTKFKALLELHGFNPGDGKFQFVIEEHICLKDRLDMDIKLSDKIVFPVEYWYGKYNVPFPKGGAKSAMPTKQQLREMLQEISDREEPPTPVKRKKQGGLSRFFD